MLAMMVILATFSDAHLLFLDAGSAKFCWFLLAFAGDAGSAGFCWLLLVMLAMLVSAGDAGDAGCIF